MMRPTFAFGSTSSSNKILTFTHAGALVEFDKCFKAWSYGLNGAQ